MFFLKYFLGSGRYKLNKSFLKHSTEVCCFLVFTEVSHVASKEVFEVVIQKLCGMWHHVDMEERGQCQSLEGLACLQ